MHFDKLPASESTKRVLHFIGNRDTNLCMLQAYVGIVSRRGIELFCPEHPETMRFMWRRVKREQGRVAGFWSVVPADAVEHILAALQLGRSRDALSLMQQHAREYGSLIYCEEDASPVPVNWDHG